MESVKAQDPQSTSWTPQRDASLSLEVWEPGEPRTYSLLKASRLEAQEGLMCQFEFKPRRRQEPLLPRERASLYFHAGLQLSGRGIREALCSIQCSNLRIHLIPKLPHWDTQKNIWPSTWAFSWCMNESPQKGRQKPSCQATCGQAQGIQWCRHFFTLMGVGGERHRLPTVCHVAALSLLCRLPFIWDSWQHLELRPGTVPTLQVRETRLRRARGCTAA